MTSMTYETALSITRSFDKCDGKKSYSKTHEEMVSYGIACQFLKNFYKTV